MRAELPLKIRDAGGIARGLFRGRENFKPDCVLLQSTQPKHPLQRHGEISATLPIFCRKAAAQENCHALLSHVRSLESSDLDDAYIKATSINKAEA